MKLLTKLLQLIDPFLMGILDQVVVVSGLLDQNCDDDSVVNFGLRPFWKYLKIFKCQDHPHVNENLLIEFTME